MSRYLKEYAGAVIKIYPELEAQVTRIVHLHERQFISSFEVIAKKVREFINESKT